MNEDTERRVELIALLTETCGRYVTKHRTEEASRDLIFGLSHVLGMYMGLLEAPNDIVEMTHEYIDVIRASDMSKLNVINTAELH